MLARVLRENGHPLLSQWDVGKGIHLSPAAAGLLEVDLQGVPHGLLTQYVRDPREQDGPGAAGGLELGRAGSELQQAPWEGTQGRGPIGALAEQGGLPLCSGPLRPLAGTTPQAAQRCGERLFRNPHLCCVTLRWQVLLGTRVPALTCRLVMSPLTHGDILSSYCPFPISTWMCPLAISGSATADEGESLEPPRPLLSSRGGYIPGTDTKAGTAQLQLTCTHTVSGERRQSGLTLPSPLPTDTAPSALGRQPLSPPEPAA